MRRRLQKFLPIVLLTLMVQILAPIGASWAAGLAISDPISAAAICQGHGSVPGQADQNDKSAPHHDACCSLCCLAQAMAPIDTPQTTVVTPYRQPARVVWRDLAVERLGLQANAQAQARAPPTIS